MNRFSDVELFLLDMDGTVYLGEQFIGGAREFLTRVRESGRRFVFLTNNASKSERDYIKKLKRMGFPINDGEILTAGEQTADYLLSHYPSNSFFVLGTDSLKEEFTQKGIRVSDNGDAAVVSFHTSLCYDEMRKICDIVRSGAPYIATHPDMNCPTEDGFMPDAGANIAFIHASTGRYPDRIIGKPAPDMILSTLERHGVEKQSAALVGDRLYTDIKSGLAAGVLAVLTLSGETKRDALIGEVTPDIVINSVADITPYLKQVPQWKRKQ